MHTRTTRDFPAAPSLFLPTGCLTAPTIAALARALERLASFHRERGALPEDVPCVTALFLDQERVFARVWSDMHTFKLELVNGEWLYT